MPAELKLQKYNPYNDHIHVFLETYVFKKPQLNGRCKTKNRKIPYYLLLDMSSISAMYLKNQVSTQVSDIKTIRRMALK